MSNKLKRKSKKVVASNGPMTMLEKKLNARLETISDRDHKTLTRKNNIVCLLFEIVALIVALYLARNEGTDFFEFRVSLCTSAACVILSGYSIFLAYRQIKKLNYSKQVNIAIIILHSVTACVCFGFCIAMIIKQYF